MIKQKIKYKILMFTILTLSHLTFSCEKQYVCVCSDIKSGNGTHVDSVKTTNLGKKGYAHTCESYNSDTLVSCHLK